MPEGWLCNLRQRALLKEPSFFSQPSPGEVCAQCVLPSSLLFQRCHGAGSAAAATANKDRVARTASFAFILSSPEKNDERNLWCRPGISSFAQSIKLEAPEDRANCPYARMRQASAGRARALIHTALAISWIGAQARPACCRARSTGKTSVISKAYTFDPGLPFAFRRGNMRGWFFCTLVRQTCDKTSGAGV